MVLTGGSLCGAIRYEISTDGGEVADYCHCRQCRAASGAPVLAWVQVPPSAFRMTTGVARRFVSSTQSSRWFCPNCGSPIFMTDVDGKSAGITLGTLDDPNLVAPTVHGWESAKLAWFDTQDSLPRHAEYPPYDL